RRRDREAASGLRANTCKSEHRSRGFDQLPSKQYAIQVRMVRNPAELTDDGSEPEVPDDVVFKPFKPFTSLDSLKEQKKQSSKSSIPQAGPLEKRHVVKSITGFHQIITLNVAQLGRNVSQAVVTHTLPSDNMSLEARGILADRARRATIGTVRRVVRVTNDLLAMAKRYAHFYLTFPMNNSIAW
ncbi:hypothetical protein BGZ47_011823, partial [Haplosporangium gracile]